MTAGSKSTTTWSSAPSARSPSIARTPCSPVPTAVAEHWAVIASLIETCKLLGLEPHGDLTEVITRIVNRHPQTRIGDLMPWAYLAKPELPAVA